MLKYVISIQLNPKISCNFLIFVKYYLTKSK